MHLKKVKSQTGTLYLPSTDLKNQGPLKSGLFSFKTIDNNQNRNIIYTPC